MIVTGFYTPDYRPLAERLSRQLDAVGASCRFYPHQIDGGWDRQLMAKPLIVIRAMCDFPDQTIVLMDVDCEVRAPILDLDTISGDVALAWRSKVSAVGRANNWPSSRVVVFRQTDGARALANNWLRRCRVAEQATRHRKVKLDDELMLSAAVSQTEGVSVQILPDRFAAHEDDEAPEDAVIVHQSAHDKVRTAWTFQKRMKAARRRLISKITGRDYVEWKYGEPIE